MRLMLLETFFRTVEWGRQVSLTRAKRKLRDEVRALLIESAPVGCLGIILSSAEPSFPESYPYRHCLGLLVALFACGIRELKRIRVLESPTRLSHKLLRNLRNSIEHPVKGTSLLP